MFARQKKSFILCLILSLNFLSTGVYGSKLGKDQAKKCRVKIYGTDQMTYTDTKGSKGKSSKGKKGGNDWSEEWGEENNWGEES